MQRQDYSEATSTLGNTPNLNIGSYTKGNPYKRKWFGRLWNNWIWKDQDKTNMKNIVWFFVYWGNARAFHKRMGDIFAVHCALARFSVCKCDTEWYFTTAVISTLPVVEFVIVGMKHQSLYICTFWNLATSTDLFIIVK